MTDVNPASLSRAGMRSLRWIAYAGVAAVVAIVVYAHSTAPMMTWRVEAGILTALCVVAAWWVLAFLLRSDVAGLLAVAMTIGLAAGVSRIKQGHLGEPLYPWDLLLVREAATIARRYVPLKAWIAAAVAGVVLLAAVLRFRRGPRPPSWMAALGLSGLAWVVTASPFTTAPFPARNIVSDLPLNAAYNGPMLSFLFNVGALLLPLPKVGSEQANAVLRASHAVAVDAAGNKPDVVVILSEAWLDVGELGSRMNDCLSPHARQRFLSPTYGGNTANVEFELHTGYPVVFVPRGMIPYRMYIRHPLPNALPATFRAQGYDTLGIHNFQRTFWNRDRVYPLLGFDRFIGIEDMGARVDRGVYPDDAMMFDAIAGELARPDRKPRFIFAASMMNHGLYNGLDRYPRREPLSPAVAAALDPTQRIAVGNYVAIAHDFEQLLCNFIAGVAPRDREIIVVAFGDHWPSFGPDKTVYRELHVSTDVDFTKSDNVDAVRMHRTPLVAWSNRRGDLAFGDGLVPSYGLGAEVLSHAGLPLEGVWAFEYAHYRDTLGLACCYRDKAGHDVDLRDPDWFGVLYRDAFDRVLAPSTSPP